MTTKIIEYSKSEYKDKNHSHSQPSKRCENFANERTVRSRRSLRESQQLELFPLANKRQKPQITSVPGVSPKERNRYRVTLAGEILGDLLTLDEAVQLAKQGGKHE